MEPKVSIIVPVYNAERFIAACIDSILRQNYSNLEVILVDDGSQDASGQICLQYASLDPRVRYVHKANGGVSSARNEGIRLAQGEYIVFVDSDDYLKEDMLLHLMARKDSDFSMCGYELYDDANQIVIKQHVPTSLSGHTQELLSNISMYLDPPFLLGPCFKLFRKEIIDRYNLCFPVELSYGEDAIFVFEYLMHCQKIEVFPYVGYSYRKHGNETLSSKFLLNKIDINYRINCLIDELLKRGNIEERAEIVSNRLLDNLVTYTQELIRSNLKYGEKKRLFYEKFALYRRSIGKPKRLAQAIVVLAGKCRICYLITYLFKMKG